MSEHHGFFHHKKDYEESSMKEGVVSEEFGKDYEAEVKNHKHKEHLGELGVVAAGAFALHEKHKEKKDPDNADKHKFGEAIGAVAAVAAGGYALHEHHEKKEAKENLKVQEGKHHHHLF